MKSSLISYWRRCRIYFGTSTGTWALHNWQALSRVISFPRSAISMRAPVFVVTNKVLAFRSAPRLSTYLVTGSALSLRRNYCPPRNTASACRQDARAASARRPKNTSWKGSTSSAHFIRFFEICLIRRQKNSRGSRRAHYS